MKTSIGTILLLICLSSLSQCVVVKIGEYEFPLEAVKNLTDLINQAKNEQFFRDNTNTVCKMPALPGIFKPICTKTDADEIFNLLGRIGVKSDVCEICAFAACTGC
ncbi:guanylin-like precursor [Callorhinchus milii]|uniref:Guanylate cyclase activator 2B n=1 Tax=Callorhinchus milii TaxID=7868 RepID=K4G5D5_CALMI|nr:guanylin family protein precursor [Callorhinchus milii]AFK10896.1 guanylin-like protein [Callorhinchus milii]AFM86169.1 guanylin-like protein [Callorhinchus milii]AFM86377.1 guanylin-like protein [Callorhinchus milii]AFM86411.1 guanylin-like protein [Callorhinchus milii]AFM86451.1 guanylin-like protein [Callorhinchus milii]|eukprot:gi/632960104/ref/XP_007896005.1/ PREDICTED: guanylin-like [Callorhinchus milii]